jgi:hypothetical protein
MIISKGADLGEKVAFQLMRVRDGCQKTEEIKKNYETLRGAKKRNRYCAIISMCKLMSDVKGTVPLDFLPLVFFIKQSHLGP